MRSDATPRRTARALLLWAGAALASSAAGGCPGRGDGGADHGGGAMQDGGMGPGMGQAGTGSTPDDGELHALWQLNHAPMLDDLIFEDSKIVCGPSIVLCATAHDLDADPLRLSLETARDCSIDAQHAAQLEEHEDGTSSIRQCWTLSCHELGKIDLRVLVHDLVEQGDGPSTIEALIANAGGSSHGELSFHAYFDGTLRWPDRDGDGYGSRKARAQIDCDGAEEAGWSHVRTDCDDHEETTFPGAPELCGDRRDNDCNGLADEKCIVRSRARRP